MSSKPLCFVLMPYGKKPDPTGGGKIDFDAIYRESLRPAIEAAGMEPIRADEERSGGIIHKPMFERLMLCEYAIADLTTANPNVFYELGVRHAVRPATTLAIFAEKQPLPFDVNFLRALPYGLGKKNGLGKKRAAALRKAVKRRLEQLREFNQDRVEPDSPVFQLVSDWQPGDLGRIRSENFAERTLKHREIARKLEDIRIRGQVPNTRSGAEADLGELRSELGRLDAIEATSAIDLMATYRALGDPDGVEAVYEDMPETLRRQVLVRQQRALAHCQKAENTRSRSTRALALAILSEIADRHGADSETMGLMGRCHKDDWLETGKEGHLEKAIDAYVRGFDADPMDFYPGINALTLLDALGHAKALERRDRLHPVVAYAAERGFSRGKADYWTHATRLELAFLAGRDKEARKHLKGALASLDENWKADSTVKNLTILHKARSRRCENVVQLRKAIDALKKEAKGG